ncbi:Hydroxydechloroatrazine ethylaminohydrolase [Sulfitobacter sp. THAF37]|uniref:formimidoylglutamate deiminase n=1 Tax=Sulfitobacter sp. THAF37 TaxID=2587855 RepID=UPI0012AA1B7E|nr:formimidoylglutamate deiminase [Sulfitobacter sp. THAF37]QFT59369.1 Hydroxydechloroatrazine ethylaminohydrolase [Sulfitobacter sp. THAF37]
MIHAKQALLAEGWADNVRLTIDAGTILRIETDAAARTGDARVDTLLPSLGNLHSHAFQRAMAGMTEFRQAGRDSFWTWRDLMYRFMDRMTPEQIEAIAAQVYVEMLEAGFASVGEFHYVHHQPGGRPYDNPAELSERIFAAAAQTGIGLTHLPVLYTYGGAGQADLTAGQRRFGNDADSFARLTEHAASALRDLPPDARIGIAPHSLRAISPEDLARVVAAQGQGPIHIHIAEQPQEVRDIEAWLGARPVAWLLDNQPVDDRWCLIHATHMTDAETDALAASGAVAGLCPITEANLGDGPFNGPGYAAAGGRFGIGSDSNINISLTEELRTLEYSQRLRDTRRNVMIPAQGAVGAFLYTAAARGGAQALNRDAGVIETGRLADLVAIDSQTPALCALSGDGILDCLAFAAKDGVVTDVWAAGRHAVLNGRHPKREEIFAAYRKAVAQLIRD